jgi:hypothetical protein
LNNIEVRREEIAQTARDTKSQMQILDKQIGGRRRDAQQRAAEDDQDTAMQRASLVRRLKEVRNEIIEYETAMMDGMYDLEKLELDGESDLRAMNRLLEDEKDKLLRSRSELEKQEAEKIRLVKLLWGSLPGMPMTAKSGRERNESVSELEEAVKGEEKLDKQITSLEHLLVTLSNRLSKSLSDNFRLCDSN